MDAFTGCRTSDRFCDREALRSIFRPVIGVWRLQYNEELYGMCKDIIKLGMYIHVNRLQWGWPCIRMFVNRNLEEIIGLPTGKRRKRWEDEVPTMLPATGRQHRRCIIPQTVTYSLVLLKMGKIISRSMLS